MGRIFSTLGSLFSKVLLNIQFEIGSEILSFRIMWNSEKIIQFEIDLYGIGKWLKEDK